MCYFAQVKDAILLMDPLAQFKVNHGLSDVGVVPSLLRVTQLIK